MSTHFDATSLSLTLGVLIQREGASRLGAPERALGLKFMPTWRRTDRPFGRDDNWCQRAVRGYGAEGRDAGARGSTGRATKSRATIGLRAHEGGSLREVAATCIWSSAQQHKLEEDQGGARDIWEEEEEEEGNVRSDIVVEADKKISTRSSGVSGLITPTATPVLAHSHSPPSTHLPSALQPLPAPATIAQHLESNQSWVAWISARRRKIHGRRNAHLLCYRAYELPLVPPHSSVSLRPRTLAETLHPLHLVLWRCRPRTAPHQAPNTLKPHYQHRNLTSQAEIGVATSRRSPSKDPVSPHPREPVMDGQDTVAALLPPCGPAKPLHFVLGAIPSLCFPHGFSLSTGSQSRQWPRTYPEAPPSTLEYPHTAPVRKVKSQKQFRLRNGVSAVKVDPQLPLAFKHGVLCFTSRTIGARNLRLRSRECPLCIAKRLYHTRTLEPDSTGRSQEVVNADATLLFASQCRCPSKIFSIGNHRQEMTALRINEVRQNVSLADSGSALLRLVVVSIKALRALRKCRRARAWQFFRVGGSERGQSKPLSLAMLDSSRRENVGAPRPSKRVPGSENREGYVMSRPDENINSRRAPSGIRILASNSIELRRRRSMLAEYTIHLRISVLNRVHRSEREFVAVTWSPKSRFWGVGRLGPTHQSAFNDTFKRAELDARTAFGSQKHLFAGSKHWFHLKAPSPTSPPRRELRGAPISFQYLIVLSTHPFADLNTRFHPGDACGGPLESLPAARVPVGYPDGSALAIWTHQSPSHVSQGEPVGQRDSAEPTVDGQWAKTAPGTTGTPHPSDKTA
ncbi:hypothetical protein DFH06DRAFT_1145358 [Mycena polygramma]|nr:hypothetical protein DFH06DRAFT_1145358 [Mycena polygramma]